jgi:hypothetical protein
MKEPDKHPHETTAPDEGRSEAEQEMMDRLELSLGAGGFKVMPTFFESQSPDLVVEDKEGRVMVLEVKVRQPRNERLAEMKDTLSEIRQRNQSAGERLAKLKQRLAAA